MKKKKAKAAPPPADEIQDDQPAENTEQVAEAGTAEEQSENEVDRLARQVQELQERLIRQQAEFDNVRKRLRRDMEEAGTRALVRFVRPLLTELDNFDLAIQAATPERFNDFAMGVTMTKQNIDNTLASVGIEVIPNEGVFDPARHEVVQEIERDDLPRGTIVEVLRNGYQINQQVIRASQVLVARPPVEAADHPQDGAGGNDADASGTDEDSPPADAGVPEESSADQDRSTER